MKRITRTFRCFLFVAVSTAGLALPVSGAQTTHYQTLVELFQKGTVPWIR
jgi:hypothetical protein